MAAPPPPPPLLFLSLEFLGPLFSGNGQYSRCLVRGLKSAGATVLVVSGRRADVAMAQQDSEAQAHARAPHGVVDIPLTRWGTLDASSDWEAFARAAGEARVVDAAAAFAPVAALAVDWHGVAAWHTLSAALAARGLADNDPAAAAAARIPLIYLNFRVYATSTGLAGFGTHAHAYRAAEAGAVRAAAVSVALCRSDAVSLAALALGRDPVTREAIDGHGRTRAEAAAVDSCEGGKAAAAVGGGAGVEGACALPDIRLLLPPLRSDMAALAAEEGGAAAAEGPASSPASAKRRRYFTSAVRLSPEKGPHRFAALVEALAPTLRRHGLVPFLCGSIAEKNYAHDVVSRVTRAMPDAVVESSFMGPSDMRAVFSATALNVHAALADAYGMTIVEAAAFGAPSVVHVPPPALQGPPAGVGAISSGSGSSGSGGSDSGGVPAVAPAPPVFGFVPGFGFDGDAGAAAAGSAGYFRATWGASPPSPAPVAGVDAAALSLALCGLRFPTVGACDLLGDGGGNAAALLPVDFDAPIEEVAARIAAVLDAGAGVEWGEGSGDASAGAGGSGGRSGMGARARAVALSWTEAHTAAALLALTRDAVAAAEAAR